MSKFSIDIIAENTYTIPSPKLVPPRSLTSQKHDVTTTNANFPTKSTNVRFTTLHVEDCPSHHLSSSHRKLWRFALPKSRSSPKGFQWIFPSQGAKVNKRASSKHFTWPCRRGSKIPLDGNSTIMTSHAWISALPSLSHFWSPTLSCTELSKCTNWKQVVNHRACPVRNFPARC